MIRLPSLVSPRRRGRPVAFWLCVCLIALLASPLAAVKGTSAAWAGPLSTRVSFADTAGHWAETSIAALAARGVVAGVGEDRFDPQSGLTRAQLAKLAVAGLEGSGTADLLQSYPPPYSDLSGHWARGWIAAATELDLVRGYGDGRFGPDDPLTRAEVAAVLVRALGWESESIELVFSGAADAVVAAYPDAADVPAWAVGYVAVAVERGLIRGYEDRTIRPGVVVSRAEAAVLLFRALDRLGRAFDIGGELVEVDDAGRITLANVWGWPDDGRRLALQTSAATAVFRNGERAQLADLVTHDTLLAILGGLADGAGEVAPVIFLHALSWDVLGTLVETKDDGESFILTTTEGSQVEVHLGRKTTVWRHGRPAAPAALVPGDRVYALIDPLTGRARIVDAVRPQVMGVLVDAGRQDERVFVEIRPDGASPGPDLAPQRIYLSAGAFVSLDGLPASAEDLGPGQRVILAEYDPGRHEAGYCEAMSSLAGAQTRMRGLVVSAAGGTPSFAAPPAALGVTQAAAPAPTTWTLSGTWSETVARQSQGSLLPVSVLRSAARLPGTAVAEARGVSIAAAGAPDFWALFGAFGEGVTVAIVDSGVDPSHPVVATTVSGDRKLVDWVDFTGEGRVDTVLPSASYSGHITTRLGPVRLGPVVSRSGIYRSGVLRESALVGDSGLGLDLNGNGRRDDSFVVVLVDAVLPGVYDTAIVDGNGNLDLRDDSPQRLFRVAGEWSVFGTSGQAGDGGTGFGYVVSELDSQGRFATIGFDGNGHGTHVAAVCAGHDPAPGAVPIGMAPGARLMVLKALGSDGGGGWDAILRAVTYAAAQGADLAVLAVESLEPGQALSAEYGELTDLAREFDMPIFLAAGNGGPGSGSAASVPDPEMLVPVGGYVSAEMWRRLYGWELGTDGLWLYSAVGPGSGGGLTPRLVAPAAAVSAVPKAVSQVGYELFEGTSMAVPHAAGAAALLLSLARLEDLPITARGLIRCLSAGASALPGVGAAEQGYGVLSPAQAADYLPYALDWREVQVRWGEELVAVANRNYAGPLAVDWPVLITNTGTEPLQLALETAYGQVDPERGLVFLAGGTTRRLWLRPSSEWVPGEYDFDDLAVAGDPVSGLPLGAVVIRVPARLELVPGAPDPLLLTGQLPKGTAGRWCFQVPDGCDWLELSLAWLQTPGGASLPGALRVFLYSPTGYPVAELSSFGEGTGPAGPSDPVAAMVLKPPGGLWEIVVWGEPDQYAGEGALGYALALQAGGRPGVSYPARATRPGGNQEPVPVTLTVDLPAGLAGVTVEALGWLAGGQRPETARRMGTVMTGGAAVWRLPPVPAGSAMLDVALAGLDSGDVDLLLYHLADGGGFWHEVGRSENVGGSLERVLVSEPAPGEYAVAVQARGLTAPLDVVIDAVCWPSGTAVLDRVELAAGPAGQSGPREVQLMLPSPPGVVGEHRAVLVIRELGSQRPLMSLSFDLARGLPGLLPFVGPSLAAGAGAGMGAGGGPVVRVRSDQTLETVVATLSTSGRATGGADGSLVLRPSLLGGAAGPGGEVQVTVGASGHEPWTGQLFPAGLEGSVAGAVGSVDGGPPYPPVGGDDAALRHALRLKCTWQE
ncbi:MAG: S-layer homology domain-containing protein [Bacillota bacterium]|nr:S-layer homology domain-containing protein [Bacillota bacterium]